MESVTELVKSLPFGDIGFASLVVLAIVMIFRGDIVPRSSLEAMRTDRDAIIASKNAEVEMLKKAYTMSEAARLANEDTDKQLLEMGRTTVHLLQSIHERANRVEGS